MLRSLAPAAIKPAANPFQDGSTMPEYGSNWSVANDGIRITRSRAPKPGASYLNIPPEQSLLLKEFPVLDSLYGYSIEAQSVSMPTVESLNKVGEILREEKKLAVAGLSLVLVPRSYENPERPGETRIYEYTQLLANRQMAISSQPYGYHHDVVDHAMGAITLPEVSFSIFTELAKDALKMYKTDPAMARKYAVILGESFDRTTGGGGWLLSGRDTARAHLLGTTLKELWIRTTETDSTSTPYDRAKDIMKDHGIEIDDNWYGIIGGEGGLGSHYEKVAEALSDPTVLDTLYNQPKQSLGQRVLQHLCG